MPVIQKYIYEWPEGATQLTLEEWVKTLPIEEQEEFKIGEKKEREIIKTHLTGGRILKLKANPGQPSMLLKDEESLTHINELHDECWLNYFNRYLEENGITLTVVPESI